jgi:hypothetical protein
MRKHFMPDETQGNAASTWIKEQLDRAVEEIMNRGIFDEQIAEARPIWSVPQKVMIGQVRIPSEPKSFIWVICGDFPTDVIGSATAATPREAARHFSLKWQMDATRQTDASATALLTDKAEELYAIVEEDRLWQAPDES